MLLRVRIAAVALGSAAIVAAVATAPAHTAAPSPTRGVVLINTNLALENASAAGTGIVLTKNGEVVTNNHVIRGATTIKVVVPATHRTYTASVLGYDISHDVALLKLQGAANLATATRGSSSSLKVGQATRAVGNANGGGRLVMTTGSITGLHRSISVQDDSGDVARLTDLIQTSARLVPGDSGGPLLDASGRVIGIDAAGSPTFGLDSSAPGFAIPINRALAIVKQVESGRSSSSVHVGPTAFIGLTLQDSPDGIAIGQIVSGSPADKAGLEQGDVLNSANGTRISSFDDLRAVLFTKHPGDTIALGYTDALGNESTATIVLASGPPQ
jgi:S1-C subfamily serine protease